MMHQRIGKTIFIYLSFLIILTTINNKNFIKFEITNIEIEGLDHDNKNNLKKKFLNIDLSNIFKIDKDLLSKTIESINLVQQYNVFNIYPSKIKIRLKETELIGQLNIDGIFYLVGTNGKLISSSFINNKKPYIFGKPEIEKILKFKSIIDNSTLNYDEIQNLYFYKSGRWDIETKDGVLIKLPSNDLKKVIKNISNIISNDNLIIKNYIDARVNNQIILYE